jgi:long-subunit acyl-CoA synthetase (AMP-forming)
MSLKKYKTRYCPEPHCSRELEKWQRVCSECRTVNSQLSKDIYSASKEGAIAQDRYNKSEKGKIVRRRADKTWREKNREQNLKRLHDWKIENKEHIKKYNREYYKNKSERKNADKRKTSIAS